MPKPIFTYFTLKLKFLDEVPDLVTGRAMHGLAFRYMKLADPEISARMHDAKVKPFTLSMLQRNRDDEHLFTWRWTVLDLDLYIPVTNLFYKEWAQQRERSLDRKNFYLAQVDIDKGKTSKLWTTEDLMAAAEARANELIYPARFGLRFVSPTAFKESGNAASLLPIPNMVWGSLSRRLDDFAPGLTDTHLMRKLWNDMLIAEYHLSTHQIDFPGYVMKGFTGNVRYVAPRGWTYPDLYRASLLLEAAPFLGIGAKTSQGMGQVRIDKSWK